MEYAFQIFERRKDWPLVDVTTKSIEEAATEVVALLGRFKVTDEGFDPDALGDG
jgi:regulator of PEP synthase PpsR (kinase-PPPase family)